MKGYLSIGQISKIKNVSIKSLRYYDEIGILKPAYVNTKTGYRYYKEEQFPLIDAISLCIELGIPLREFTRYKSSDGSIHLENLLFDGKILAEQKIRAMSDKLTSLHQVLRMLESGQTLITERIVLCIPFDEFTTSSNHNPKLLELLVTSQRLGMKSTYPSGLLYIYPPSKDLIWTTPSKYLFINITDLNGYSDFDENGFMLDLPNTQAFLKRLTAGMYISQKNQERQIENGPKTFKDIISPMKGCELIELDIISENGNNEKRFELQVRLP